MALVVETGTGTDSNANSYVSVAETSFFADRDLTEPSEGQLLQAMDLIESMVFAGTKTVSASPLSFPRNDIADTNGVVYGPNVIPDALKKAQLWLGHYIALGHNPAAIAGPQIKRDEFHEVFDVEYFEQSDAQRNITLADLTNFQNCINHLLASDAVSSTATTGYIDRA